MKLLQINVASNSGSHGRIAEEIGSSAIKAGHKSYIAAAYANRTSHSEVIKIGSRVDRNLHGLKTRLLDKHGFGSAVSTRNLVTKIKRIDPDLIHLHNIHGYYLSIDVLFNFLKEINKPVIWTFHDCWPFTGHCAHFQDVNCEKWKTQCHHCPLTGGYPASWIFDNSYSNYFNKRRLFTGLKNLTIVSPSHWLKYQLKESFLSDYEITVINNGIDLDNFKMKNSEGVNQKFNLTKRYILGVANVWTRKKGLNDFLKLRALLDSEIKIALVGLTKNQIRSLPDGITGITRTENTEELAALYSGAEAFVNPTYVDNFPSVNIEALACGTPVITYKTGGSPEAIDNNTGIIVEKGDIMGLNDSASAILSTKDKYTPEQCRIRAERFFSSEERCRDYLKLYEEVLDRH
jgi:glycosyltransferase involved in cell wall biosynthesis